MGATLGNPEMLCVTDGDTKAYGREAMCSDKHMQTMAELSPECCHFHATITASRIQALTLWPEIWPKPINGLGKLGKTMYFTERHLKASCPDRSTQMMSLSSDFSPWPWVSNRTQTVELDTSELENRLHTLLAM